MNTFLLTIFYRVQSINSETLFNIIKEALDRIMEIQYLTLKLPPPSPPIPVGFPLITQKRWKL